MQIRSFWPQWDLGEKAGGDSSGEYYRLYNREEANTIVYIIGKKGQNRRKP